MTPPGLVSLLLLVLLVCLAPPIGLAIHLTKWPGRRSKVALAAYIYVAAATAAALLLAFGPLSLYAVFFLPIVVSFAAYKMIAHGAVLSLLMLCAGFALSLCMRKNRVVSAFLIGLVTAPIAMSAETAWQRHHIALAAEALMPDCLEISFTLFRSSTFGFSGGFRDSHAEARIDNRLHLWSFRSRSFEPLPERSEYYSFACPAARQ